jgi:hypothetical protein
MYIQSLITKVKNTKEENPVQTIELENNRITIAIYYSLTQAFKHLDPQERESIINDALQIPN